MDLGSLMIYHSACRKKARSLFGLLNRCVTSGGVRTLRSCLFQPPRVSQVIGQRADAVQELIDNPEMLMGLRSVLARQNCDIDHLLCLCVVQSAKEGECFQYVTVAICFIFSMCFFLTS